MQVVFEVSILEKTHSHHPNGRSRQVGNITNETESANPTMASAGHTNGPFKTKKKKKLQSGYCPD